MARVVISRLTQYVEIVVKEGLATPTVEAWRPQRSMAGEKSTLESHGSWLPDAQPGGRSEQLAALGRGQPATQ